MAEYINYILAKISIIHVNVLLLLGLALFLGTAGGRVFQKIKIPQVVGYIAIGMAIGHSGLRIIDGKTIIALAPFNYLALGLIGFIVGGELRKDVFAKYGKPLTYILLCEGITPFFLVFLFTGIVGTFMFGPGPFPWALGLLMGSIASATDPATTSAVLKEYKTRGPVTTNTLGIVALDDGLALLLFAIASSIASVLVGNGEVNLSKTLINALYEVGGAIALGSLSGILLSKIISKYSEKERTLVFTIGTVLIVTGLSQAAHVSMLLSVMTLGIFLINSTPKKSKEAFSLVEEFMPPIYVLFFVMVGAKLKLDNITLPIFLLVFVYLIFGLSGKSIGAYIGAKLSKAPATVVKYLPFALYSQAGIAIGLSILVAQYFPGAVGDTLVVIITATTLATQLIGPTFTKFAVQKAGEMGLNITEEDIVEKSNASDVMDKNPPLIYENMQLSDILKVFTDSDNLYYPVVSRDSRLRGIITIEGIKQTFMETDIGGLILAHDVMQDVTAKASESTPLAEIRELIAMHGLECIPVVGEGDALKGFIERKNLNKFISTKIISLQERVDSFEKK